MKKMQRNVDYVYASGMAITLSPDRVCAESKSKSGGPFSRTHDDGWTIEGVISEDYVYWVNDFTATHSIYGTVRGNFEEEVFATSKKGFKHFYANHAPEIWDYMDI
jgi:hypothetical protein